MTEISLLRDKLEAELSAETRRKSEVPSMCTAVSRSSDLALKIITCAARRSAEQFQRCAYQQTKARLKRAQSAESAVRNKTAS
jgi:hypothetical protein